ncbi:MAG: hypothetical protein LBT26_03825 [Clostridiales Family XIII bacterium]|jgi:hypothetical protein|nr:hypothetical protein [Clostridiales Family XIII bacterium]
MDLIREKIQHRQYGSGVIVTQTQSTVTVRFAARHGEKRFKHPSAFESFLTLCDPLLQERMDGDLRQMHEQQEAERKQQEAEAAERQTAERLALLEQKRAAAKKPASGRKKAAPAEAQKAAE